MLSSDRYIQTSNDVSIASIISDVILGFYLSILGHAIYRTMERIESNQPFYTTLVSVIPKHLGLNIILHFNLVNSTPVIN